VKRIDPAQMEAKRRAAERAVALVEDGMVLGLGSGSTAALALEALAKRIAGGLWIGGGIPTSERTAVIATRLGIPLTDFERSPQIDLAIVGADQVERGTLNLVKGLGGALLREKIVASASKTVVIVADETKLVQQLGAATPVPVEIVRFGWQAVLERLRGLGCTAELRRIDRATFVTDGGNYVADCSFDAIPDAAGLEASIKRIAGVIESGLFIDLASQAVIGNAEGVEILAR